MLLEGHESLQGDSLGGGIKLNMRQLTELGGFLHKQCKWTCTYQKTSYGKLDNDKTISFVVLGTYFGLRNSST